MYLISENAKIRYSTNIYYYGRVKHKQIVFLIFAVALISQVLIVLVNISIS